MGYISIATPQIRRDRVSPSNNDVAGEFNIFITCLTLLHVEQDWMLVIKIGTCSTTLGNLYIAVNLGFNLEGGGVSPSQK